jgi:hypothetical protein
MRLFLFAFSWSHVLCALVESSAFALAGNWDLKMSGLSTVVAWYSPTDFDSPHVCLAVCTKYNLGLESPLRVLCGSRIPPVFAPVCFAT